MKGDDFDDAIRNFTLARQIMTRKPAEAEVNAGQSELDFVIQQLALATYKSKQPTERTALESGLAIIEQLHPGTSHDVETLGIAGAIRKRLWKMDKKRENLDKAIEHYGQGFHLQKDYYNGENYATCLDLRSDLQTDEEDAAYDAMTARKVRKEVIRLLGGEFVTNEYEDRPDKLWMNATMANCLFAVGRPADAQPYEDYFKKHAKANWELNTYQQGKEDVLARLEKPSR